MSAVTPCPDYVGYSDIRQRAIALLDHLSLDKLEAVAQLLEVLAEATPQPSTNPEESRLIDIIQRQLLEREATASMSYASDANGENSLNQSIKNSSATKIR